MTTAEFCGEEFEVAYANVFGGKVNGGFNDHGHDVLTGIAEIPSVQVKASLTGARYFLLESVRRRQFIPLCVGEPGTKEEMINSLKRFGAWVGKEIVGRDAFLMGVAQVRIKCEGGICAA